MPKPSHKNRKRKQKALARQKLKTNKAAAKRLKVTANGKILFRPAGSQHLMSAKRSKRRRQMRRWKLLDRNAEVNRLHVILGTRSLKRAPNPAPAVEAAEKKG